MAAGTEHASSGRGPTTLDGTPGRAPNPSPKSQQRALGAPTDSGPGFGGTGAKPNYQSMQVCHCTNALCTWAVPSIYCVLSASYEPMGSIIPFHPFSWHPRPLAGAPFPLTRAATMHVATRSSPPPYPPCVPLPCETPTCRSAPTRNSVHVPVCLYQPACTSYHAAINTGKGGRQSMQAVCTRGATARPVGRIEMKASVSG